MSHRRGVARAPRLTVTILYLLVHAAACSTVDGGAIQLSWRLRPNSGAETSQPLIECTSNFPQTGPVTGIRVDWQVGSDSSFDVFDCNAEQGITRFVVPPGQALISVSPVCESGPADTSTYTAPAPVQRTVTVGNTVSMGAVELILQVSSCNLQPCICQ